MTNEKIENYTSIGILVFFLILSFFILKEVLLIIIYSFLLGYFLKPIYNFLIKKKFEKKISSILTLGGFICIIFIPLVILTYYLVLNLIKFVFQYQFYLKNPQILDDKISTMLLEYFDINLGDLNLSSYILDITNSIVQFSSNFFYSIPAFLFYFFIVMFITYYILIHTDDIFFIIKKYLPVNNNRLDSFIGQVQKDLKTLVKGYFLTGLAQTFLAYLCYLALGVPALLLVTFLTFITSLIPYIGTPIIWVPMAIYIFFTKSQIAGIILFIYGIFVISSVDNFLRPFLMSDGDNLSPPLVFVGFVGGLATLGIPGMLLGPLVLSSTTYLLKNFKKSYIKN